MTLMVTELRGSRSGMSAVSQRESSVATVATDDYSPRERVTLDIIHGLYEQRYVAGQRLVEKQLTADNGVSRGPVREALNRLAASGAITLRPNGGATVRLLSIKEAIDILVISISLSKLVAGFAAINATDEDVLRLARERDRILDIDPITRLGDAALARTQFHRTLAEIAGNSEIERILPTVQIHMIRLQFDAVLKDFDQHIPQDHVRMVDAIARHHVGDAERTVAAPLERGMRVLSALTIA